MNTGNKMSFLLWLKTHLVPKQAIRIVFAAILAAMREKTTTTTKNSHVVLCV